MINTSANEGSAKIYQFPAGGRAALGGRRYGETKAATDLPPRPSTSLTAAAAGTTQRPSRNPSLGVTTDAS